MKRNALAKRLAAAALALGLLALTACGGQTPSGSASGSAAPASDALKGIYEALIAPESDYSQMKESQREYYPELQYTEELKGDQIVLTLKANGNQYISDGSWTFTREGDRLNAEFPNDDYSGVAFFLYVAEAAGTYLGMESELVSSYINGLGALGLESGDFTMTRDEAAGTTALSIRISGPWEMKELDQMLLDERVLDAEPLGDEYASQGGSVGKLRYMTNGSADDFTVLLAEYGDLDELAYQSIVNLITLRQPAGWEAFLADFTELKALDTDAYRVTLDPDEATVEEIMGQQNEKFRCVLLQFGAALAE